MEISIYTFCVCVQNNMAISETRFTHTKMSHSKPRGVYHRLAPPSLLSCVIASLAVATVAGCSRHPYSCVRVSGKVTYEDGSLIPAEQIRLIFISKTPPTDPKTPARNGLAIADVETGDFESATTYVSGDGIIEGEQKVIIQCIRKGILARELVAAEFSDPAKTPFTVNTSDSPFLLKIRKPAGQ